MCVPQLAIVGLMMQGAAVGMGTVNAYQQSKTNKAIYNYESSVASNNQQMAEWNAQDAIERGQRKEGDVRLQTAQLKGTQRATLAARGLDLSEGSALNILTDTDFMGERDALRVRADSKREAWAYREQAKGYGASAAMLKARSDAENPWMAAAGTLLGGGGQVASRWYETKERTQGGGDKE